MRTLICGLLIPFAVGFAQQKSEDQAKKIEITYSLAGPEMYRSFCAPCHGVEGKGNGPAASALKKAPADLTLLSQKNGGKFPAQRVREYIEGKDAKTTDAHGSREMPIWGDLFRSISGGSEAAVQQRVVNLNKYIETLQKK